VDCDAYSWLITQKPAAERCGDEGTDEMKSIADTNKGATVTQQWLH